MSTRRQQTLQRMTALALVGVVVGLLTAFATIGFVALVSYLNDLLYVSTSSRARLEAAPLALITIAVLTIGGLVVGLLLHYGVDRGEPIGPADTIFAAQLHERLPPPASGFISTLAAALSLGCGASVGQYGPLVYLGTLIGQVTNRWQLGLRDIRSIAIACGVAAAISTAFNAPIAALIFTHEVILRHYSMRTFAAVAVASACGYLVASVIFEYPPLFLMVFDGSFRSAEFVLFAVEGIACGLLAVVFMKLLHQAAALSAKIQIPSFCKPMLAGFVVSLVALQIPEILGAGQELFDLPSVAESYTLDALILILVAKLLVTVLCIGFGFAGGVIFPSLLIGVLFGEIFALLVPGLLFDDYSGLSTYAVCGMMAVVSPVIGAPMTALLLVFELTRSYELTIAAMVAIVFANFVSHRWYGRSLYDHQLVERGIDLSMGRERAFLMHRKVAELAVDSVPVLHPDKTVADLRRKLIEQGSASAVMTDEDGIYLGFVSHQQLACYDDHDRLSLVTPQRGIEFDQTTSIWDAMEAMRGFVGEAVVVIDSDSGRYLGVIPEAVLINAYLDAAQDLRREEHEV